jgi:DNA (cytosine-5)-methyltransferase 1
MRKKTGAIKFIDLFCGIGGFRIAMQNACYDAGISPICVFSSDIDEDCREAYKANFGETPVGDITCIQENEIPDHDLLLAGFPCQPFSICGDMKGFEDIRGTLFFDIARILKAKRPKVFLLENVKLLASHNKGKTLARILETVHNLGYRTDFRILNALDFGLPQKRERIFIVGFQDDVEFSWPVGKSPMRPLDDLLEHDVHCRYFASEKIRQNRLARREPTKETTIWHENKAGNVSAYPFSCALRAGASYNYLLVNGERRLTPREMLRLQGFPDDFQIVGRYQQIRKQAGNSVPVPVVIAILRSILKSLFPVIPLPSSQSLGEVHQLSRFQKRGVL